RVKPEPARREHSQKMPTRKEQHITVMRAYPLNDAIGPRGDLAGRFSAGTAVAKQTPIRSCRMNLCAASALILTVVPFEQIRFNRGQLSNPRQFASAARPLQGARQNLFKSHPLEPLPEPASIPLAALRQRQIRPSGMLPGKAPGSLAVTREIDGG